MNELIEALKIVQAECKKAHNNCDTCPLGNEYGYCQVSARVPAMWQIKDEYELNRVMK